MVERALEEIDGRPARSCRLRWYSVESVFIPPALNQAFLSHGSYKQSRAIEMLRDLVEITQCGDLTTLDSKEVYRVVDSEEALDMLRFWV